MLTVGQPGSHGRIDTLAGQTRTPGRHGLACVSSRTAHGQQRAYGASAAVGRVAVGRAYCAGRVAPWLAAADRPLSDLGLAHVAAAVLRPLAGQPSPDACVRVVDLHEHRTPSFVSL